MTNMKHDGSPADQARTAEAQAAVWQVLAWAESHQFVRAVALVGSWARHDARTDSDLDLVVLAERTSDLLAQTDWPDLFGSAELVSSRDFGGIQERRLRLASGFEVEVGIGSLDWAAVPVDPGTATVARDGLTPLYDPDGHLHRLLDALDTCGGLSSPIDWLEPKQSV
jgi:predicted nucleotidyltransferase